MAILQRTDLQQPPATGQTPGFIPVSYVSEIIKMATLSSIALSSFRQVRIPTASNSIPVLSVLPSASWVVPGEPTSGDYTGGQKATTDQQWKGVVITAEEVACVIVVPEQVIEDSTVDLFAEITPSVAESIGAALDVAAFGGVGAGAPASFGPGIIADAVTAGNVVVNPAPDAEAYNDAFKLVETGGFSVDNIYAALSEKSNFRSWNAAGIPTYVSDWRSDGMVSSLFGVPLDFDNFGALGDTLAVVGDGSKAIVGTRTDMMVKVLDQAIVDISPGQDGSMMVNLATQDSVALRIRARFGIGIANPATRAEPNETNRYPFAVVNPA